MTTDRLPSGDGAPFDLLAAPSGTVFLIVPSGPIYRRRRDRRPQR